MDSDPVNYELYDGFESDMSSEEHEQNELQVREQQQHFLFCFVFSAVAPLDSAYSLWPTLLLYIVLLHTIRAYKSTELFILYVAGR